MTVDLTLVINCLYQNCSTMNVLLSREKQQTDRCTKLDGYICHMRNKSKIV